jgi:hypothetical protein
MRHLRTRCYRRVGAGVVGAVNPVGGATPLGPRSARVYQMGEHL